MFTKWQHVSGTYAQLAHSNSIETEVEVVMATARAAVLPRHWTRPPERLDARLQGVIIAAEVPGFRAWSDPCLCLVGGKLSVWKCPRVAD